jgi:SARP family transcriptional regulator, regulator of embCAB operon
MQLAAHFLGEFRVVVDGHLVDTASSRRTRTLVAYLLAHRDAPVARDVLMDRFWPAVSPLAARNSLHVALSGARRVFRDASAHEVIQRRFDTYRIDPATRVWTDVEEFERTCRGGRRADLAGWSARADAERHFEAAAQLYQGDFLADEPYAEWAATIRDSLRQQAIDVQTRLVEMYADRGDHGPASVLARRLLAIDPCNERVHRRLMGSYAAAGLRHLALIQFHQLSGTLWETLRVRPSAETIVLYERLRRPELAHIA